MKKGAPAQGLRSSYDPIFEGDQGENKKTGYQILSENWREGKGLQTNRDRSNNRGGEETPAGQGQRATKVKVQQCGNSSRPDETAEERRREAGERSRRKKQKPHKRGHGQEPEMAGGG